MRTLRPLVGLSLLVLSAGCARTLADANPEDVPLIREQLQQSPGDETLRTRLGIALYKAGEHGEARDLLGPIVMGGDAPAPAAYLYLGLSSEALEDWSGARNAYTTYLGEANSDALRGEIERRLQLIIRQELRAQARASLAQEAELSSQPPQPRSIAVFPFQLITDDPELEPLQVALADMMITDLQLSQGVTVLERTQIQSLLDEMALADAGLTEAATGARAGRLLRAEHVVQGALTTLGDEALRVDADVVNTQQGQAAGEVTTEEPLTALFDMEKTVVFQVLDVLGVVLTPAERQAITENRAENLLAFLAYGRGLQAMDRGDYAEATGFFQQAVQLDPGFQQATTQQTQAGQLEQAANTAPEQIAEQAASSEMSTPVVASAPPPPPPAPPAGAGGGAGGAPAAGTPAAGGGAGAGAGAGGGAQAGGAGTSATLGNVSGGVNPSPTGGMVQTTSATGTGGGGTGGGQTGQQRNAVQESQGEGVTSTATATIVIQIRRPGG